MSESEQDSGPVRILVVDDHPMMREGLASVISSEAGLVLAGEASDGEEAIARHRALRPDVTLMDLQMPRLDGIAAIAAILKESPDARILVLSTFRGDVQVKRALDAGACGYILKNRARKDMVDAIRAAHAGRMQIDADVAAQIALHRLDAALTAREIQVLQSVAQGHSNKEVARELGITEDTVKSYMKSILSKLRANDRTHAVSLAFERGILTKSPGKE